MATDVLTRPAALRTVRPRIKRHTLVDYGLDVALFFAFVVDMNVRFTGLTVHEWLGIGFGAALAVHLVRHTSWIGRITRRFATVPWRERLRWIVDLGLFVAMTFCVASGLLISERAVSTLGTRDAFWRGLHVSSAQWTVYLTAAHLALTWRWVVNCTRRIARRPA